MAEQRRPSARASKRRARPSRAERRAARTLYVALTGEPLPDGALSDTLVSSLTTLQNVPVRADTVGDPSDDPVPGGPPRVWVFVRRRGQGTDCDQTAEIAGTYVARLKPGQACVGKAEVKRILDEAAAKMCCATLRCPSNCPCSYVPQPKLATYWCLGDGEGGSIVESPQVWNCICFSA